MIGRDEYEKKILARNPAATPPEVVQGPIAPQVAQMGGQMATESAAQGNAMGTAGGGLMTAGAMSGNPYLMAGGLGLSVIGAGEQNKRNQEEAQRKDYNDRIAKRQEMMGQIAKMGIQ
ncbi:MAG: hypothetical protein H0X02_11360 [Nitrosomonas sp.]|nr:hypothetical protein [Nitrosomonas sp.]